MVIKFNYDFSPRKKGDIVEFSTREELRIAEYYTNAGIAIEYVPCEDCKDGKKGCKDCGDVAIVDEPKEEIVEVKEPVKRTRKTSKK